jgi:hypothetical protein
MYNGTVAYAPGSSIVALAQVPQGSTGTLSCQVVTTMNDDNAPVVNVVVGTAMGVSINDVGAGYTQFATN